MLNESEKILLLNRIKENSKFIYIDSIVDDEDLANQTWLYCIEIINKDNLNVHDLPTIWFRHRCQEVSKRSEFRSKILTLDIERAKAVSNGEYDNFLNKIIESEEVKLNLNKYEEIKYILTSHPKMSLSAKQWIILNKIESINPNEKNIWKATFAEELGVTRQAISKSSKLVQKRIDFSKDLLNLWSGDIYSFFVKHASDWLAPGVRKYVWSVLKPDFDRSDFYTSRFNTIIGEIYKICFEILDKFKKTKYNDPKELSILYNLIVTAVYIDIDKANDFVSELKYTNANSWLLGRFIARASHLVKVKDYRETYNEWLKYLIKNNQSRESRKFADYIICYYGGVSAQTMSRYLFSGGDFQLQNPLVDIVITESYINISEKLYKGSQVLLDLNYLRMILVLKVYYIDIHKLTCKRKNAIYTMSQIALKSNDTFVSNEAFKVLKFLNSKS